MINTQEYFPESRYKHCHNVGLKMYSYAKFHMGMNETQCQQMFLLGILHDVGYELNSDAFMHDVAMSEILKNSNYIYADEIEYHSYLQHDFDSQAMKLLYFGDMTVDGQGNWVSFEERLCDIKKRHGIESDVYKESVKIANQLIEWGFDDSLSVDEYISSIS